MLIINLLGLALVVFIIWWFWLYKPDTDEIATATETIEVANGVYSPAHIRLPKNQVATLHFLRKDQAPCSEMLLIPELGISVSLPINKLISVDIPATQPGNYAFHCQMQMYRGELIIE